MNCFSENQTGKPLHKLGEPHVTKLLSYRILTTEFYVQYCLDQTHCLTGNIDFYIEKAQVKDHTAKGLKKPHIIQTKKRSCMYQRSQNNLYFIKYEIGCKFSNM